MFFGFEDRFYEDAKNAELSFAALRVKSKRFKAGLAGSKLAKLRLIVMVFPFLALLLPAATLQVNLPHAAQTFQGGLLGMVSLVMGNKFALPFLLQSAQSEPLKTLFFRFDSVLLCYALLALLALAVLLLSMFSFLRVKRLSIAASILSLTGALCSLAAFFFARMLSDASSALEGAPALASAGFGAPLAALVFLAVAWINWRLGREGVEVEFDEGDLERAEIYAKVKRGGLCLAELPYPVVETEATRAREAEIQAQMQSDGGDDSA
jgi:hypothetical protein